MKETVPNTIFNIYLLYPTNRDDKGNFYRLLQNYTNIGTELQAYLLDWEKMKYINDSTPFPKSYLYVPADHEWFIQTAYKNYLLTGEDIGFINRKIISKCNLLINFGNSIKIAGKGGSVIEGCMYSKELECAKQEKVPIYNMPFLSKRAIQALRFAIKTILKSGDNIDDNMED